MEGGIGDFGAGGVMVKIWALNNALCLAIVSSTKKVSITSRTIVGWVDVFTRATYGDIIIENLSYCQKANNLEQ